MVHCAYENKNLVNVHSGQRSQEITFDFISAQAGIYRQAKTIDGDQRIDERKGCYVA